MSGEGTTLLTADLVRAFRRQGVLKIRSWKGDARLRAGVLAKSYVAIAEDLVGSTRSELIDAIADIPVGAREQKLAAGLRKMVLDRCEFESDAAVDPVSLREELFTAAAQARREGAFDRDMLIQRAAEAHEQPAEEIERLLFADLKDAQRLLAFDAIEGELLVNEYDEAQVQAVLLKAESIVAEVSCSHPGTYRALFRKLKFLRLLHEIEELDADEAPKKKSKKKKLQGRYRITMSGPMSLFRSNTKYGLSLALALPSIRACDEWSIDAVVRWGKDRSKLMFRAEGKGKGASASDALPDEVQTLVDKQMGRVEQGKGKWQPHRCSEIMSVPGLGVIAPDLYFEREGEKVYLEIMGFWSRDAVWKRVELASAGLPVPMVFAVPQRLRVSEEVLPDDIPAMLYVYKGVMSPKRIEACLDAVSSR